MEAERYWFLVKGFTEAEKYWEYWEKSEETNEYVCTVSIRKGILHCIHTKRAWYYSDPDMEGKRKFYRNHRGRTRSKFLRWSGPPMYNYLPYNRDVGDFVAVPPKVNPELVI